MFGHVYKECDICGGDGKVPAPGGETGSINCPWCLGGRSGPWGDLDFIGTEIELIKVKVNQTKADINQMSAVIDNIWNKVK